MLITKPTVEEIVFNDPLHTYTGKLSNVQYTSVTTYIGKFSKPFDAKYHGYRKALEKFHKETNTLATWIILDNRYKVKVKLHDDEGKKEFYRFIRDKYTRHELAIIDSYKDAQVASWETYRDERATIGNDWHLKQEAKTAHNNYNYINGQKFPFNYNYTENLFELGDGLHTEPTVYHNGVWISGKVDLLNIETVGNVRYVDIADYKTSLKVTRTSPFGKMLSPFGHLDSCNWNKFKLQVSLYMWILQQWGFTPRHCEIIRVLPAKIWTEPFEYMEKEMDDLMGVRYNELFRQ